MSKFFKAPRIGGSRPTRPVHFNFIDNYDQRRWVTGYNRPDVFVGQAGSAIRQLSHFGHDSNGQIVTSGPRSVFGMHHMARSTSSGFTPEIGWLVTLPEGSYSFNVCYLRGDQYGRFRFFVDDVTYMTDNGNSFVTGFAPFAGPDITPNQAGFKGVPVSQGEHLLVARGFGKDPDATAYHVGISGIIITREDALQ